MGLRDILITAILLGSLPFVLTRAYIGIYVWSWLGYMNPHKLAFGFAYNLPVAQIVGIATLIAFVFSNEPKRLKLTPLIIVWLLFLVWMMITTFFALVPELAAIQFVKIVKIQLFVFLTIILINSRIRLEWLLWIIVVSIGIFGVKGGLFTLLQGGGSRVYGPPGGFFFENNALAVATLMILPLMLFLIRHTKYKLARWGMYAAITLCILSILGSHSRGAIIAGLAVVGFFWLKSRRKLITAIVMASILPPLVLFMPSEWAERRDTIIESSAEAWRSVEETHSLFGFQDLYPDRDQLGFWPTDQSAIGRVNAWNFSINIANGRLVGGGFDCWSAKTFAEYAPIADIYHAAHSIYFSVLGEHGWIGFGLFALIFFLAWRLASRIHRDCKSDPDLVWYADLARMIQVSLVAWGSGGAFLSLSYFDLPWQLVAILVVMRGLIDRQLAETPIAAEQPLAPNPQFGLPIGRPIRTDRN